MTVEWFDLGQRLHAAATGRPAPRLLHAPLPPLTDPVAVRARSARGRLTVTAATPGQPPATAEGEDAGSCAYAASATPADAGTGAAANCP